MPTKTGGCHCGAVRFEATLPPAVTLLDCNCSMCAKTSYLHLIVPAADFRQTAGADVLTNYQFNTGAARHLFCSRCGIKSFYIPRSHPDGISINFRCLDDSSGLAVTTEAYDGRNWEAARAALG